MRVNRVSIETESEYERCTSGDRYTNRARYLVYFTSVLLTDGIGFKGYNYKGR